METMPLLVFILYSIPESIILVSFGAALHNYDVKGRFKRIILVGFILASTTYLSRFLPLGVNILVEMPFFFLATAYGLGVRPRKAVLIIITSFVYIALMEVIYANIVTAITGISLNIILSNLNSRLLYSELFLFMIGLPAYFIIKNNLTLFPKTGKPRFEIPEKIYVLATKLVLASAFVTGLILSVALYSRQSVWVLPIPYVVVDKVASFTLMLTPLISLVLLRKLSILSENKGIQETQAVLLSNIDTMFTTLRGQRHDFIQHVQVLYSMLSYNKKDDALDYMKALIEEIREVNETIKTRDPVLSALLSTKKALAQHRNLQFETDIRGMPEKINLKPYEIAKIFGNLIDNAFDAVSSAPEEYKIVRVTSYISEQNWVVEVYNEGPAINKHIEEKIFSPGFTTKKDHSGVGLAVVKDLVTKLRGSLTLTSNESDGTTFKITFPLD